MSQIGKSTGVDSEFIDAQWLQSVGFRERVTAMGNTYYERGAVTVFRGRVQMYNTDLHGITTRSQLLVLLSALEGKSSDWVKLITDHVVAERLPAGYTLRLEWHAGDVSLSVEDPDGEDVHFDLESGDDAFVVALEAAENHLQRTEKDHE